MLDVDLSTAFVFTQTTTTLGHTRNTEKKCSFGHTSFPTLTCKIPIIVKIACKLRLTTSRTTKPLQLMTFGVLHSKCLILIYNSQSKFGWITMPHLGYTVIHLVKSRQCVRHRKSPGALEKNLKIVAIGNILKILVNPHSPGGGGRH